MGIPGLVNILGSKERIALSRLAITHLERNSRPIRIAVDISIWLFQAQAGRGGQNPELRTLFFRLLRLLALPIHPLFVYDGRQKPPFKRGKAVGRSYGSAPIISLSKILIDLFKFPRHDAPGEAEAECARLQRAGVVDAVMSNDVDALMFGSTLTVMNFSKESSSGTAAATHVDCYRTQETLGLPKNVGLSRAGMILFAMLSGGDYLPSGVAKCGSKLAGEIVKGGFGDDLLEILASDENQVESKLDDWRDRLQYELEENESGYFVSKHKAVRIPEAFPDRTILSFYANPMVSTPEEIELLREELVNAWDHEIDALQLRMFVADTFDWKYRSGAKKVIRNLAEPLVCSRLRLRKPPVAMHGYGSFIPNQDVPVLQRVYRSRAHYSTDGISQLQLEIVPVDVVGLDLEAEESNPPPESSQLSQQSQQEAAEMGDEEDDPDVGVDPAAQSASEIKQPRKRYDPYEPEKIWIFESVARIGIPDVVDKWKREQQEKAAPKKPASKKTTVPRKKKPIDSGMKPGGILRFTTVTKPRSEISLTKQSQLFEAAASNPSAKASPGLEVNRYFQQSSSGAGNPPSASWQTHNVKKASSLAIDDLVGHFTMACSVSDSQSARSHSRSMYQHLETRRHHLSSQDLPVVFDGEFNDHEALSTLPAHAALPGQYKVSYTNVGSPTPVVTEQPLLSHLSTPSLSSPMLDGRRSQRVQRPGHKELEATFESLSLATPSRRPGRATRDKDSSPQDGVTENESDSVKVPSPDPEVVVIDSSPPPMVSLALGSAHAENSSPVPSKPRKRGQSRQPEATSNRQEDEVENVTQEHPSASSSAAIERIPRWRNHEEQLPYDNTTSENTVGTIHIHDGFWTVETHEEQPVPSSLDINSAAQQRGARNKKEKIGGVSFLDLS